MDDSKRGTKRKRYEPSQEDLGVRIGGKLHHDLKEVRKAAKKAKVFETQKLVKKLKGLRRKDEKSEDVAEAEAQLVALKAMDHEIIANTALKTKLNKDRVLLENEHVQAATLKELSTNLLVPEPTGTPGSKVQSRLLSSKILAVEIATVVEDLRNVLQPKLDPTVEIVEEDVERPKKQKKGSQVRDKSTGFASLVDQNGQEGGNDLLPEIGEEDEAGWESGTVGDDEQEQGGGWESGSLEGEDDRLDDESGEYSDVSNEELQIAPSITKPPKKPTVSAPTRVPSKPTGMQSTFLPSLSVGFVRGGSDDSEMSENEAKVADIDLKKNRRGQRARRAIWEKKYGRNANHKKKESEFRHPPISRGTDQHGSNRPREGHASSKGPPGPRPKEVKPIPQHQQEADSGWGQRISGVQKRYVPPSRAAAPVRTRREEKPMHPSWEAKRKLKEKESAGIVPSQGKKIKFS